MTCSLCQGPLQYASDYRDWGWSDLRVFNNLKILVCLNCGLGVAWPPVARHHLEEFYSREYRRAGSPFYLNFSGLRDARNLGSRAVAQISLISAYRDFARGSRILDIGAGAGGSFAALQQTGEDFEFFAIEPAKDAAEFYSQKYGVTSFNSLAECHLKNQIFDVVIMSHVLEHFNFEDVLPLLEELHSCVSEDGLLLIEVPHEDYRDEQVIDFVENTPHLSFFTKTSLEMCLVKAGWTPIFSGRLGPIFGATIGFSEDSAKKSPHKWANFLVRRARKILVFLARIVMPAALLDGLRGSLGSRSDNFELEKFFYNSKANNLRVLARKNPVASHARRAS